MENKGENPEEIIRCEDCMKPLKEELQLARTQEREKVIMEIGDKLKELKSEDPKSDNSRVYDTAINDALEILNNLKKEKGE
jgi:hypothetical protein